MAQFSHGSTRTTRSAGLRSPVNTRLTSSRDSLVRAEWAMKCSFCKLARLPRLRPRMRMTSAIPQAMRRSPGTGSGLDVSSNGPSSNVSRKSGDMAVWREIERAAKQPLRDRSQSDLQGASVGEVRDALLQLGDQRSRPRIGGYGAVSRFRGCRKTTILPRAARRSLRALHGAEARPGATSRACSLSPETGQPFPVQRCPVAPDRRSRSS